MIILYVENIVLINVGLGTVNLSWAHWALVLKEVTQTKVVPNSLILIFFSPYTGLISLENKNNCP